MFKVNRKYSNLPEQEYTQSHVHLCDWNDYNRF